MIPGFLQVTHPRRRHRRPSLRALTDALDWRMGVGLLFLSTSLFAAEATARQTVEELGVHAQRVMVRGLTWLQNGYPDRAAAVYAEGLKVHPDNAALLSAMSQAQEALGDLGSARFYLDQALEISPDVSALFEQDLELALASGDQIAASAALERMESDETIGPHYILRQLTTLMRHDAAYLARGLADHGRELFPDNVDVTTSALAVYLELGEQESIVRTARRLVTLRGSFEDTMRLAQVLMRYAAWAEAVETLEPVVRADPYDAELLAMMTELDARLPSRDLAAELGITWTVEEERSDATSAVDSLSILRAAWEEQPEDEDRVVLLVDFLLRTGSAREAALLADEHNAAHPRHLRVWALTIQTWLAAGEIDTALRRAEDAALLFPGYAPILLSRAEVLAASGNEAEAIRMVDALIQRIDPDDEHLEKARMLRSQLQQPQ